MTEKLNEELVFDPPVRLGKWHDNLINSLAEEAESLIAEYGWDPEDLTEEQIDAINAWVDEQDEYGYEFIMSGFRNVLNWAESELWEKQNNEHD